jgi:TerC family integral membrane protein
VLFFGILGALLFRAAFIAVGSLLVQYQWVLVLFGAFLVYTGFKMLTGGDETVEVEQNRMVRFFRRLLPITENYEGERFFVRRAGRLFATPLALVLVVVESSDLIFAIDSIPAIFGVTQDPFIVYTSNVFAILGLRSLYFLIAGMISTFRYLKIGLALVLQFVGGKMLIVPWVKIPIGIALGVVVAILASAIFFSIRAARREAAEAGSAR